MKSNLFEDVDLFSDSEGIEIPTGVQVQDKPEEKTVDIKKENGLDDDRIEVPSKSTSKAKTKDVIEEDDENLIDHYNYDTLEEDEETPPNESKSASSSSPFKPFAKALYEEGFLASYDDEEFEKIAEEAGGEVEALFELTKRTIQNEIEEYKNNAEADYKAFLEAKESGIDLNKWADVNKSKKEFENITKEKLESDESLQKKLVSTYLKEKGFSTEEIDDTIETYEDTGKLEIRAAKALEKLKEIQAGKEKQLKIDAENQEKERIENYKKTVENLKKNIYESYEGILPGVKLNKKLQDTIYKSIVEPAKELPSGEKVNAVTAKRLEDPVKYAIIEAYLVATGAFDGKVVKEDSKTKSKALAELKKSLDSNKNTAFKTGKFSTPVEQEPDDNWRLPNL
jgi:2C-methyl-D-erythritol 2,4-cyclodiphosphate synthase